jgi:RNA polymerase sigma-70 factor, ECF subfamily
MRKNWLAGITANAVVRGARTVTALAGRWFRSRPVVPDAAFQSTTEPYPGHWREFPEPWSTTSPAQVQAALAELPDTWRTVVLHHDSAVRERAGTPPKDDAVAAGLGLTVAQERDILARARAALRDAVDRKYEPRPR